MRWGTVASGGAANPGLHWTLTDRLGSVREVVSGSTGALENHLEYDEHGVILRVLNSAGASLASADARAVDAAFAGREFVDELGLSYNRSRWYDPALERFVSEDPARADQNLYRYAENDPVGYVDPTGLALQKPTSFGAGLGSAASTSWAINSAAVGSVARSAGRAIAGFNNFTSSAIGAVGGFAGDLARVGATTLAHQSARSAYNAQDAYLNHLQSGQAPLSPRTLGPAIEKATALRYDLADRRHEAAINQIRAVEDLFGGRTYSPFQVAQSLSYSVGAAFQSGLATGGKAVGNATANTLAGAATLGFGSWNPFAVTQQDIHNGYNSANLIASGSTGLLTGLATGALGSVSKVGRFVTAYDAAGSTLDVGRGVYDASQNGLGWANAVQIVGGGAGVGGNVLTGGGTLAGLASDASRVRFNTFGVGMNPVPRGIRLEPRPDIGAYRDTGGHHIHAQAAFRGVPEYNSRGAVAVSLDFLSSYKVAHSDISAAQQRLFGELARSGLPNNLTQHSRVAFKALVEVGIPRDVAKSVVATSQSQLIQGGVFSPSRIPWNQ